MEIKKSKYSFFVSAFKRYFGITPDSYAFHRSLGCLPVLSAVVIADNSVDRSEFVSFINSFNRLTVSDSCVKFLYTLTDYLKCDGSVFRVYSVFPCGVSITNILNLNCWFSILDKIFNYEV